MTLQFDGLLYHDKCLEEEDRDVAVDVTDIEEDQECEKCGLPLVKEDEVEEENE